MYAFDFGRLRTLRRRNHLSQKELGGLIGYSGPNIGRWENGEIPISAEDLAKVSTVLGDSDFQSYFVRRAN